MLDVAFDLWGVVMRSTSGSRRLLRSVLVANGFVALLTSSGALVVLLVAPLGLAAVVTCTAIVGILSFSIGLAADLWLLQHLAGRGD